MCIGRYFTCTYCFLSKGEYIHKCPSHPDCDDITINHETPQICTDCMHVALRDFEVLRDAYVRHCLKEPIGMTEASTNSTTAEGVVFTPTSSVSSIPVCRSGGISQARGRKDVVPLDSKAGTSPRVERVTDLMELGLEKDHQSGESSGEVGAVTGGASEVRLLVGEFRKKVCDMERKVEWN